MAGVEKRGEGQMEGRKDIFPQQGRKCLSDRHRVSKNRHAESPMALGVITDVRVGVLAFAQVAEGRRCHWLQGGTGVKPESSHSWGQMRPDLRLGSKAGCTASYGCR